MPPALLDLGFLEEHVLARPRVVLLELKLLRLGAGILLGDVEIAVSAVLTSLIKVVVGLAMVLSVLLLRHRRSFPRAASCRRLSCPEARDTILLAPAVKSLPAHSRRGRPAEIGAATQRAPNAKVSREEWIERAKRVLIEEGEKQVKILGLAKRLGVTRGSFYHHFQSRQELIEELLASWRRQNTAALVRQAERPADSLARAILNVFTCWTSDRFFDPRLDFAVREWGRRSPSVRALMREADAERTEALAQMYCRHGFEKEEAFVRARVLYLMQIGYFALESGESLDYRLSALRHYVVAFGGSDLRPGEVEDFVAWARTESRI